MNITRSAWLTAAPAQGDRDDHRHAVWLIAAGIDAGVLTRGHGGGRYRCRLCRRSDEQGVAWPTTPKDSDVGKPINRSYWEQYELTTQYEGAERMAERCTDGKVLGTSTSFTRDESLRPSTLDELAALKPTGRTDGVHTAGTSTQIADGTAVLMISKERADELGLEPVATVVDATLVGCDPVLMLEGPIPATRKLLGANGLSISDMDVVEINEAFAAVVLAWDIELKTDLARVNPNGGAIALGHPLGATGAMVLAKAAHELVRADGEHALVTMCCGGGLGTGTPLRRG
jgi:acetyl-CoA C-acetyltransferase